MSACVQPSNYATVGQSAGISLALDTTIGAFVRVKATDLASYNWVVNLFTADNGFGEDGVGDKRSGSRYIEHCVVPCPDHVSISCHVGLYGPQRYCQPTA